jgi:hypothetical protein
VIIVVPAGPAQYDVVNMISVCFAMPGSVSVIVTGNGSRPRRMQLVNDAQSISSCGHGGSVRSMSTIGVTFIDESSTPPRWIVPPARLR